MPCVIGLSGRWQSGKDTVARMLVDVLSLPSTHPQFHVTTRAFAAPLKRILQHVRPSCTLEEMETDAGKNRSLPTHKRYSTYELAHVLENDINKLDHIVMSLLTAAFREPSLSCEESDKPVNKHAGDEISCCKSTLEMLLLLSSATNHNLHELTLRIGMALLKFEEFVDSGNVRTIGQALQRLGTECFREGVSPKFWIACQEVFLARSSLAVQTSPSCKASSSTIIIFTDVRFPNEYEFIKNVANGTVLRILRDVDYSKSTRDPNHLSETALEGFTFDDIIDNRRSLQSTRLQVEHIASILSVKWQQQTEKN